MEKKRAKWSERVEDLVASGDVAAAISFLETLVTDLQSQFSSALNQLADLYSSQGLSLKSDELLTHSSLVKQRASSRGSGDAETQAVAHDSSDDDGIVEALADREEPSALLSVEELPQVSKLSVEAEGPKRRGRGNFTYKKDVMYSDRDFCKSRFEDGRRDHDVSRGSEKTDESLKYLEPPSQRPKTSVRTAQRLIAHSLGLKLPASGFGSKELRDQEAARENRIVSRQKQRDDALGR